MELEVETNPWNVLSLEAFRFYNCPECDDKYPTREQFVGHAMISHQNARDTLPAILSDDSVQSILVVEPEISVDDVESSIVLGLESNICIEPKCDPNENSDGLEPTSDTENDENCESVVNSDAKCGEVEPKSDTEIDESCDPSIQTNLDDVFDTNTFEFEETKIEKVEPAMFDTENEGNYESVNNTEYGEVERVEPKSDTEIVESGDPSIIQTNLDDVFDTNTFEFEETKIEIVEPTFDNENVSNIEATSDTEMDENCNVSNIQPVAVVIKISNQEKTLADQRMKSRKRSVKSAFKKEKESEEDFQIDTKTNRYRCNQCLRDFAKKLRVKEHFQAVHQGNPFKCDQCSKVYFSSGGLRNHVLSVHESVTKCSKC